MFLSFVHSKLRSIQSISMDFYKEIFLHVISCSFKVSCLNSFFFREAHSFKKLPLNFTSNIRGIWAVFWWFQRNGVRTEIRRRSLNTCLKSSTPTRNKYVNFLFDLGIGRIKTYIFATKLLFVGTVTGLKHA